VKKGAIAPNPGTYLAALTVTYNGYSEVYNIEIVYSCSGKLTKD
jgi:hypothetical protein